MTGRYGKGFRADTKHFGHNDIAKLLGAHPSELGAPLDVAEALEMFLPMIGGVHDQGASEGCVGFTLAEAVSLRANYLASIQAPAAPVFAFRSPVAPWTFSRAKERSSPRVPLENVGCEPGLAVVGMKEYGMPSAEAWPFDMATINAEPTWGELEASSAFLVDGYHEIVETESVRILAVKHVLSQAIPVPIATDVDQAFEDYAGAGRITAPTGQSLGGHMISLIGHRPNPDRPGESRFRLLNHWNVGWGALGLAWVDEEFVRAATNLYALTLTAPETWAVARKVAA